MPWLTGTRLVVISLATRRLQIWIELIAQSADEDAVSMSGDPDHAIGRSLDVVNGEVLACLEPHDDLLALTRLELEGGASSVRKQQRPPPFDEEGRQRCLHLH